MKRIFTLAISLALAMVMCVTVLGGCSLIKTDSKKDMNQVVATVKISDKVDEEKIYKKDVILSYINQYYVYEQSYGYSREETLDLIVTNTIDSKVLVQSAMLYFAELPEYASVTAPYKAEYFLDDEEKINAKYLTYKSINDLIDSYAEPEEESVQDTYTGTTRVAPKGAAINEDIGDKGAYIQEGINVADRREAFNDTIESLKNNQLLGDSYDGSDITTTEYYDNIYKNYCEQELVENYEQSIAKAVREKITYQKLQEEYNNVYTKQSAWSLNEFISASSSLASGGEPITYTNSETNGYGRVYHILLKASDAQIAEINEWKTNNPNAKDSEILAKRQEVFNNIEVFDQRTSWVYNGYDFDGVNFTGDYTFLKDKADSIPYMGTVTDLTPNADAEEKEYRAEIKANDKMTVSTFMAFMEEYLYGSTYVAGSMSKNVSSVSDPILFEQKIQELMFAFSNDDSDSALNAYKGYEITPRENDSSWEVAFWEGGKELIAGNYGDYGYVVKATSYGYHIMFLSERYGSTYNYQTIEQYLNKEYSLGDYADWQAYYNAMMADWDNWEDTNNYLYSLVNSLSSTAVNNALNKNRNDLVNEYIRNGNYVVRYDEVYKDLM